jgi:hypothetical protein
VQAAELVDTLNSEGPFTIFAPASCAFEEIPEADLTALLEDTDALTDVLTSPWCRAMPCRRTTWRAWTAPPPRRGGETTIAPRG